MGASGRVLCGTGPLAQDSLYVWRGASFTYVISAARLVGLIARCVKCVHAMLDGCMCELPIARIKTAFNALGKPGALKATFLD